MSQTHPWVPVALSADVPAGSVIPATIPSGAIALWRSQSGTISASNDRCPHRGMRLSHGFVRGETLSCIYHGWSFEKSGRCRSIPAHPDLTPPQSINCGSKSAAETDGVIWVTDEETDSQPPRTEGLKPLRSLQINATANAIATASGASEETQALVLTFGGTQVKLLLAQASDETTLAHLLVDETASPENCIAASRSLECLRMKAEEIS